MLSRQTVLRDDQGGTLRENFQLNEDLQEFKKKEKELQYEPRKKKDLFLA